MTTKKTEGGKKRVYMTLKKVSYAKEQSQAELILLEFRKEVEFYIGEHGYTPTKAELSMDSYNSLLKADFGLDKIKPKLIGELFGVRIFIDPMLPKNIMVLKNENYD